VELGDHERDWLRLWVKLWLVLLSPHVADDVQVFLGEILDYLLLLACQLVLFGVELEVGVAKLELVLPTESKWL